jgi:hypothetical protein
VGNKIAHAEVVGKDGPMLQKFYGEVFDWNLNTDLPGGYGIATKTGGDGADFGTGPAADGGPGWVTFYVTVADVDATLAKVEALGGKTVMPKFSPAPETWLAMFADPEGHIIGLSQGAM